MNTRHRSRPAVLMIAYTNYACDPRVTREAEAALAGGFDVDVLALRPPAGPAEQTVRGVRVLHVAQSRYRGGGRLRYVAAYLEFFLRCLIRCTHLHLRRHYQVIHVNNMPDFLVFTTVVPKLLGTKVILDIHDPMPDTFASKFHGKRGAFFHLLLWQELLSAAYADRVITVHEPVRDGILARHGLPAASIDVIANFADGEMFRLIPEYQPREVIRLAFHGTILERSGLRLLAEALSLVQRKDRIRCRIIGEGDFSAALHDLIESLGLSTVVEFDNRSYPVHEIPARLADCHAGIIPLELNHATNHAFPVKLAEYIALGLPVISVRGAAITHYLAEEDCMFYQWDDPPSLAALLDQLAAEPTRLLRLRARSVAIRERFLWRGEQAKYVHLLHTLAGTTPPA